VRSVGFFFSLGAEGKARWEWWGRADSHGQAEEADSHEQKKAGSGFCLTFILFSGRDYKL
jgi:hypothetical protein